MSNRLNRLGRKAVVALTVVATTAGLSTSADAGVTSASKSWTGHGSAYTSVSADVQRSCGFWTCESWVTSVRHYSRDYGSTYTTVVGGHKWGGTSVSSITVGYKTGSVTLSVSGANCTITAGEYKAVNATFTGGGKVCGAKSNFVVYHSQSTTQGRHRVGSNNKQWTVTAT